MTQSVILPPPDACGYLKLVQSDPLITYLEVLADPATPDIAVINVVSTDPLNVGAHQVELNLCRIADPTKCSISVIAVFINPDPCTLPPAPTTGFVMPKDMIYKLNAPAESQTLTYPI